MVDQGGALLCPLWSCSGVESEPGYWVDKLLHRAYFEEFLQLYEALGIIFGFEPIIMGVHFKDEEWLAPYRKSADGLYGIVLVPDKYVLGEKLYADLVRSATGAGAVPGAPSWKASPTRLPDVPTAPFSSHVPDLDDQS